MFFTHPNFPVDLHYLGEFKCYIHALQGLTSLVVFQSVKEMCQRFKMSFHEHKCRRFYSVTDELQGYVYMLYNEKLFSQHVSVNIVLHPFQMIDIYVSFLTIHNDTVTL